MAYIPPHKRHSEKSRPTSDSVAYIPPHKRHSVKSRPTPYCLASRFDRTLQLRAQNANADRNGYSSYAISRLFAVGMDNGNGEASSGAHHLKAVSVESISIKSFILVKIKSDQENNKAKGNDPWSSIAENVLPDLLSCFEKSRAEDLKDAKPSLQARFGKILFHHVQASKDYVTEATLKKLKKTFYTRVPASYTVNIMANVSRKIGVNFAKVKNIYIVKLSDSTQQLDSTISTISCKCRVKDDNKLQLYKVEQNLVRDMRIDISCSDMDLDFRLALTHKTILIPMTEDEMQSIRNLIDSAVLDPDVKGGLRWPLGKATSTGDRYSVVRVWRISTTTYQNASIKLKVRYAYRFDFKTTCGEISKEVVLKFKGIISGLLEKGVDTKAISDMLKDNISLIWQHLLHCEHFLT